MNVSKPYFWADGLTVSCYVWEKSSRARWIVLKIRDCEDAFPALSQAQAIRQLAIETFINLQATHEHAGLAP